MKDLLRKKPTALDGLIDEAYSHLGKLNISDEEYVEVLRRLETLERLRGDKGQKLSADTKAMIFANLAGILLILNYERVGVVTSRAIGFVAKGRV